jgi:uncharacterized membrane protein YjjP (DUF1212 family)
VPRSELTALLIDLGQALHASALPASMVESRVRDVAQALGARAEVFVLQGFLAIETEEGFVERVGLRRMDFDTHWNLDRQHALVDLCASLVRGERSAGAGRAELARIMAQPRRYTKAWVMPAYAAYGAAVAVRVGGRAMEALVGGVVGLLAGLIHYGTIRWQRVDLQKSFVAALVGAFATLSLTLVLPPFDAGRAFFGGITLLVPAMVLTIGTYELANGALESGVVRMAYGLLRFLMLAYGLAVALRLFPLVASLPDYVAAEKLPWPVVLLVVAIGGAALTFCLQGRPRDLPWMAAAALLAFGAQELTEALFGGRGSPLLAALILGAAANLYGRAPGRIPATIVIPGLLQLAPGFLGTEAVFGLLRHGAPAAQDAHFFDVLLTALQLVTGLVIAEVLPTAPAAVGAGPPAGGRRRTVHSQ